MAFWGEEGRVVVITDRRAPMSGSVEREVGGFLAFFGKGKGGHDDILDKSPLYKGVQSGQGMDGMGILWVWERGIEWDRIWVGGPVYGWAWALGETS